MKKHLLLFIGILLISSCSFEEEHCTDPFEFFWREMDRKYVYFEEKGVDWNAVYNTYKPRAAVANEEELVQIFQKIINLLKDGHVWIETQDRSIAYYGYQDESEVFYISFNGYEPAQWKEDCFGDTYCIIQLKNDIIYIGFHSAFCSCFDVNKFQNIIQDYSFTKGIIIDIRTNGGGSVNALGELASCFATGQRTILYQRNKTGHGHNDFSDYFPISGTGRGIISENIPIVLLTGSYSYSAANSFAAIMKTLPNVRLMGMPTGGGGSVRFSLIMPNGWTMYYSRAPVYDLQYNSLEPGVTPHDYIPTTVEDVEIAIQTGVYRLMESAYQYLMSR